MPEYGCHDQEGSAIQAVSSITKYDFMGLGVLWFISRVKEG